MIVTSDKDFGRWGEFFGDEVVVAAIIDRLVRHSEVIAPNGDSYRLPFVILNWLSRLSTSDAEMLFMNVELAALAVPAPPGFEELAQRVNAAGVRVVVEITGRHPVRERPAPRRSRQRPDLHGHAVA